MAQEEVAPPRVARLHPPRAELEGERGAIGDTILGRDKWGNPRAIVTRGLTLGWGERGIPRGLAPGAESPLAACAKTLYHHAHNFL